MRNGQHQNKRMRGRNRKGQNPLTRVYESNGPDVKIRGTANHIADKYVQLARDAQASGDPVSAENYLQHAEHYFRLIAAVQEQFRQNNPYYRPESENRDEADEIDDESFEAPYGTREPQPFPPREARPQAQGPREPHAGRDQQGGRNNRGAPAEEATDGADRLPAFITGGSQPQGEATAANGNGANGHEGQADRFPLHRRRRRRHGARGEGAPVGESADEAASAD